MKKRAQLIELVILYVDARERVSELSCSLSKHKIAEIESEFVLQKNRPSIFE